MDRVLCLFLFFVFSVLSCSTVSALSFEDKGFKEGEKIKISEMLTETELHGDFTAANFWNLGIAGNTDAYNAVIDCRLESHTPLYRIKANRGMLVTRVEGFGTISNSARDKFFGKYPLRYSCTHNKVCIILRRIAQPKL